MERTYRSEFPDFDYALPTIAGFKDSSWHNDACPVLRTQWLTIGAVELWCDYLDLDKREFKDGKRFTVVKTLHDGESDTLCETDSVEDAVAVAENALATLRLREDGIGFGNRA